MKPAIDGLEGNASMIIEEATVQSVATARGGRLRVLTAILSTIGAVLAALVAIALTPAQASAAVEWTSEVHQAPTNLPPGGRGMIWITPANAGDTQSTSYPTVSFQLPPGVTIGTPAPPLIMGWSCSGSPVVTCTNNAPAAFNFVRAFAYPALLPAQPVRAIRMTVDIAAGAPEGTHPFIVTVSGGGGADSVQAHELRIGSEQLPFGPTPGSFTAGAFDETGADYTQAGGHPYQASTSFSWNTRFTEVDPTDLPSIYRTIQSEGTPRDVVADLPAGFVGNPMATPRCRDLDAIETFSCPPSTQVGVATISPPAGSNGRLRMFGVYNVVPAKNHPAEFAFRSPIGTVLLVPSLRSDGDWGITATVRNITQIDTLYASSVTLWGVPADPSHDAQRCAQPNFVAQACVGYEETGASLPEPGRAVPHSSTAPPEPFLTNPTECTGSPVVTRLHLSQYEGSAAFEPDGDPDLTDPRWKSAEAASPPVTGCERLQFAPEISVTPTTTQPDAPTGLDFELRVPQNDAVDGLATAHLRDATVVLPDGMTVNPAAADGLDACSTVQIGLTSKAPLRFTKLEPTCPFGSKIGTVDVTTPLLEEPLSGEVYLARQADNPFDSLLAIYIVVRGPGLMVKLAGHVKADPQTGQLATTVLQNPRLPFDSVRLRLSGGPRATLATPSTCGPKTATAQFTSWAGHAVDVSDSFTIDCPGIGGFTPTLDAGMTNPTGGAFSPFALRIARQDREQYLDGVSLEMPKGLLAKIKGVPLCSNAQANAGSCGAGSRIGTVVGGAGVGSSPFFTAPQHGSIYLTEGYKGAPFGLAVAVRAIAGPFDLGTVVVRQALHVDRDDAQVTVISDPLPRILEGIPLRIRAIDVNVDRPGFTRNPSSCAEKQIKAVLTSTLGATHTAVERFQASDCQAMRFRPRLGLRLTGRKQARTGGHPGVRAVVRQKDGEADIARAEVRLPRSLALDPDNAQALCEFEDGTKDDLENRCPAGSIVGRARAVSPLLNRPLTGNVYFVKNVRRSSSGNVIRTLPMIIAALRGEVAINLRGTSNVKGGKLVSTFANVPDAPISRFDLRINGGSNGILAVTRTRRARINLCAKPRSHVAESDMDGQNGRRYDRDIRMKTPCKGNKKQRGRGRR